MNLHVGGDVKRSVSRSARLKRKRFFAHGAVALTAFFFMGLGTLVSGFFKKRLVRDWFKLHVAFQTCGSLLVLAALAIALRESVGETGAAFGEVKAGDVVLETREVVMVTEKTETGITDFVPTRRWRDSKDGSFEECLASMRSVVAFGARPGRDASRGAKDETETSQKIREPSVRVLSMRLCRDYVGANAIPMRGEADVDADVRWVDHDGSMEWNEEAIVSGKEWAARHAAGGF